MQENAGVFVNVYLILAETFAFFFLRFTFALHFNRKKQSMMNLFRKAITFFFLLLASVTMLAFTVVPHHHHEAYICFNAAHCEDETPCLPHGHEGHDHEDKGCVSQLFQTQVGRSQSGVEHPEDGRTLPDGQWFFLPASLLAFKYVFLEKQAFSPAAYREELHAACLATNRAGRAPPAIC